MRPTKRFGTGRGTHMGKGDLSGSTVATLPSSVTLTRQGLETTAGTFLSPTELGYLDGAATKTLGYDRVGHFIETGTADFSDADTGTSFLLNVTFTNITSGQGFYPVVYSDAAQSEVSFVTWLWSKSGTATTGVSIYCMTATGGYGACHAGTTVQWLAIGA